MKSLRLSIVIAGLLAALAAGCAADEPVTRQELLQSFERDLLCICTAGHYHPWNTNQCGRSEAVMRGELEQMLDEGRDRDAIFDFFTDKYGEAILAAPRASGFNLMAWVMPFAALFVGAGIVVHFVRTWKSQTPQTAAAGPVAGEYQQRLEEELKRFAPED